MAKCNIQCTKNNPQIFSSFTKKNLVWSSKTSETNKQKSPSGHPTITKCHPSHRFSSEAQRLHRPWRLPCACAQRPNPASHLELCQWRGCGKGGCIQKNTWHSVHSNVQKVEVFVKRSLLMIYDELKNLGTLGKCMCDKKRTNSICIFNISFMLKPFWRTELQTCPETFASKKT